MLQRWVNISASVPTLNQRLGNIDPVFSEYQYLIALHADYNLRCRDYNNESASNLTSLHYIINGVQKTLVYGLPSRICLPSMATQTITYIFPQIEEHGLGMPEQKQIVA